MDKLRPIAPQQLKKKWSMTVLLLKIEDLLMQITSPQQVGCFKHRHMIKHSWNV